MKKLLIPLLALVPMAGLAAAQPVDKYGVSAIAKADYARAEAALAAQLRDAPADPPALLNLGYVYRQTARGREANALYLRVLNRSNIELTAVDGRRVWSHDLAHSALKGEVILASR